MQIARDVFINKFLINDFVSAMRIYRLFGRIL